jgi:hypothetical protein
LNHVAPDSLPTDSGQPSRKLETDYLIVGSGAVGMAFADTLLSETDAELVIVDKHLKPGGHWNDAYPFVTLHQPSAFYGVSSSELSRGRIDEVGFNQGLHELATGTEVLAYFDEVMRHHFLPSGRVRYFPLCEYRREGHFVSITSGAEYQVTVRRKLVDATYLETTVPSTHTPSFTIAEGVWFCTPNELGRLSRTPARYVVIGGGKTGIDTCLWLLETGVEPDSIQWIMPRDGWLLDRRNSQPGEAFFSTSIGALAAQFEALAAAQSIDDLFVRLENAGVLLRLDRSVKPQMFHGATISRLELEQLRRIHNVVRLGRIESLEEDRLVFAEHSIPTSRDHLHIDCSASAVGNLEPKPIFEGNTITPQTVRSYQPVFSSAFIAHIEATYSEERDKNRICNVVPLPNHDTDWIRGVAATMMNQFIWSQEEGLRDWLVQNRLDGFSRLMRDARSTPQDTEKQQILTRMRDNSAPAMANVQRLLAELSALNPTERKQPPKS